MKLEEIQNAVADRLRQIQRLNQAGLSVLTENKTDLIAAIDAALQSLGLVAIVSTPSGKPRSTDSESIDIDGAVVITVTENVLLNRSRSGALPILSAVELIAAGLNLKTVTDENDTLTFRGWSSPVVLDGNVVVEVTFGCQFYIGPELEPETEQE